MVTVNTQFGGLFGRGQRPQPDSTGSFGHLEEPSEGEDQALPRKSLSSGGLHDSPQGLEEGSSPLSISLLHLFQQRGGKAAARVGDAQSPRASADSILEAAARCTSDPSHSNRPSLDVAAELGSPPPGGPLVSKRRAGGIDFEATSAPCSARASVDESGGAAHAGGGVPTCTSTPTYASCATATPRGSVDSSGSYAATPPQRPYLDAPAAPPSRSASGRPLLAGSGGSSGALSPQQSGAAVAAAHPAAALPRPSSTGGGLLLHGSGPLPDGPGAGIGAAADPFRPSPFKTNTVTLAELQRPGHQRASFENTALQGPAQLAELSSLSSFWGATSCPDSGMHLAAEVEAAEAEEAERAGSRAHSGTRGTFAPPASLHSQQPAFRPILPRPAAAAQPGRPAVAPPGALPVLQPGRPAVTPQDALRALQQQQQGHPPLPAQHLPPAHHPPGLPAGPRASRQREGSVASGLASPPHQGQPAAAPRKLTAAAALLQRLQESQQEGGATRSNSQLGSPNASGELQLDPSFEAHGLYGCHAVAPVSHQNLADAIHGADLGGARRLTGRSSMDLLLDPLPPRPAMSRPSMELQELLEQQPLRAPPNLHGLHMPRHSLDSNSSRDGGRSAASRRNSIASSQLTSMGRAPEPSSCRGAPFMTPQYRPLGLESAKTASFANLEALDGKGLSHAASTNAIADLASADMLAVSTPTAAAAGAAGGPGSSVHGGGGGGTTASAFASSVVDPSGPSFAHYTTGGGDAVAGTMFAPAGDLPQPWLDPELHDTFGAHALCPPALAGTGAASATSSPQLGPRAVQMSPRGRAGAAALQPSVGGGGARRSLSPGIQQAAGRGGSPLRESAGPRPTSMLDPSTVHGQHSVTVSDPQTTVPSLEFLRQRRVARLRLDEYSNSGGYIAEAKRVLSQAMSTADPLETLLVQSSQSGAIGPLLRHLSQVKHDDQALRSGLHTLSLILSNSPNRGIIINFKGQQMLFDILSATTDLEVQENIVQLLWDLECEAMGAARKDCRPDLRCIDAFLSLLERTNSAAIASHAIHFMYSFTHLPVPGPVLAAAARRLLGVVEAYRCHLQDSAQYTLGLLLTAMLEDPGVAESDVRAIAQDLVRLLLRPRSTGQCQALLTLLSCIASGPRSRAALCGCQARAKLLQFGQHVADGRLRARALSLVKVLSKQEQQQQQQSAAGGARRAQLAAPPMQPPPPPPQQQQQQQPQQQPPQQL